MESKLHPVAKSRTPRRVLQLISKQFSAKYHSGHTVASENNAHSSQEQPGRRPLPPLVNVEEGRSGGFRPACEINALFRFGAIVSALQHCILGEPLRPIQITRNVRLFRSGREHWR